MLFKNLYKHKLSKPKKFVFVVGSGRCGTLYFKELFKNNNLIDAFHERNNLVTSFYQFAKYNNFKLDYKFLIDTFKKLKIKKKIYLESSSYLSLNIYEISKSFNSKIIILFRDPLKTCKSLMKKGWYNSIDLKNYSKNKNIACHTTSRLYFHHNFSRLIPHQKDFAMWNKMPQIVKIKWFWNYIYKNLILQSKKISKKKVKFINIDEFNYHEYLKLCLWIGCKPDLSYSNFKKVFKRSSNRIKEKNIYVNKNNLKLFKKNFIFAENFLIKKNFLPKNNLNK